MVDISFNHYHIMRPYMNNVNWIIPCNIKKYDVISAFKEKSVIDWRQSVKVKVGDIIYIYCSAPISRIMFKTAVLESDIIAGKHDISDNKYYVGGIDSFENNPRFGYMKLQLLNQIDGTELSLENLLENGLNAAPQGQQRLSGEILEYIQSKEMITDYKEYEYLIENKVDLSLLIKSYEKRITEIKNKESELETLRKKFVSDFPISQIINLEKEKFVVGLDRKDTFCYRIETELAQLGDIHGSTSFKFGLYYGVKGNDKIPKYRYAKKFGDNPEIAFNNIKKSIVELLFDGLNNDYKSIRKNELASVFRGKILATYFPERYFNIFSDEHLNYFLKKLVIKYSPNDDVLEKQLKLIHWKNNNPIASKWTNYIFSDFLYTMLGHPTKKDDDRKQLQRLRDNEYPRDYVTESILSKSKWKTALNNPDVFKSTDIEILQKFYVSDNHAAACSEIGVLEGVNHSSYISPMVNLAKRVSEYFNIPPIIIDGNQVWWRVLFWGRYKDNGIFEWKIQPRLAEALSEMFPEWDIQIDDIYEDEQDQKLLDDISRSTPTTINTEIKYESKPRAELVEVNGHKVYPRDRRTALNALAIAEYKCEYDNNHVLFNRRNSNINYTEPHHLIPMAKSEEFDMSLDIEANIVSLCSNCHNQIHYGKDADKLLTKLYNERKELLEKSGIKISLEELLAMYGY